MTPETELLPCPFCQSVNIFRRPCDAVCISCGASADLEVWQNRPAPKAIDVEALKREIWQIDPMRHKNTEAYKIAIDDRRKVLAHIDHLNSRGLFGQPDRAESASAGDPETVTLLRQPRKQDIETIAYEFNRRHYNPGGKSSQITSVQAEQIYRSLVLHSALAQTPTATDSEAQKALDEIVTAYCMSLGMSPPIPDPKSQTAKQFETIRAVLSRMAPVTDGWKLVPIEPTGEMVTAVPTPMKIAEIEAINKQMTTNEIENRIRYKAMIAAAPPADRQG